MLSFEASMFEALRIFFGPNRHEPRPWSRELLPALITLALAALAAWFIVSAVDGREYPFRQGHIFWGATFAWFAIMRARAILARQLSARPIGGPDTRRWATLLSRATILALAWYPGPAVGWYAIEAENRPSVNSQGVDICAVEAAQYCVSGPRALIPWAIVLLALSGFATWFFVRSWTTARKRDESPRLAPGDAMLETIRALFPEARIVEPAPSEPARDLVDDLARLARLREEGHLSEAEFEAAKRGLLGPRE
jgi:hypothetical protein